jgi:hypothetical protein
MPAAARVVGAENYRRKNLLCEHQQRRKKKVSCIYYIVLLDQGYPALLLRLIFYLLFP